MDPREFRDTLGNFATGVTVITTSKGEELIGMTANAFTSLSVEPPLVLVCVDKKARSLKAFTPNHRFVVNILQEEQEETCKGFARKSENKFSSIPYSISKEGMPILENNLATVECTVHDIFEGGDHYIVTGLVKNVSYNSEKRPLLFFRGNLGPISEKNTVGIK